MAFTVDGVLSTKTRAAFPKARGLRHVASGTPIRDLLWDIHVHISGQSLWEPRPSKSRELMELPWGFPGKEHCNCPDS